MKRKKKKGIKPRRVRVGNWKYYDRSKYDMILGVYLHSVEKCSNHFLFLFLWWQVLEDKSGVFVNGLSQVPVLGWEAALDVLSQGVLNRTTASTLMNTVSSRSHAVFTITLTQTIKDDADPDGDPQVKS